MKILFPLIFLCSVCISAQPVPKLRYETFDREPNWEAINNRSTAFPLRPVTQNFGHSPSTSHAGGKSGEVGGTLHPAGEAAFYAYRLPRQLDLNSPLTASGKLFTPTGPGHFLLGFFNSNTLNEWRTANTLVVRINNRGETFHCHLEYCSSKWRAEAGVIGEIIRGERLRQTEIPANKSYDWKFNYAPPTADAKAAFTFTLGQWTARCEIIPEHFADGATFTHFGLLPIPKTWDSPGAAYIDDVTINGATFDFSTDPKWDSLNNRRYYMTADTRPRFDFGYSRTHYADGLNPGEIGGLIFRGDCREPARLAAYGDRLEPLNLTNHLRASGKVVVLRAISDATASIGFYNSEHSLKANPSQKESIPSDYIGINIEGPSSEGFFFYPVYRMHGEASRALGANGNKSPRIYPNGKPHQWTLFYDALSSKITVTLDNQTCTLEIDPEHKKLGATFNRFGLCTPWIDGNSVTAFFDDLTYTYAPSPY